MEAVAGASEKRKERVSPYLCTLRHYFTSYPFLPVPLRHRAVHRTNLVYPGEGGVCDGKVLEEDAVDLSVADTIHLHVGDADVFNAGQETC